MNSQGRKKKRCILFLAIILIFSSILSSTKLENLKTFAKLYGYVRFFHPSDESASIDWDCFAIYGAKMVEKVRTRDELKNMLYKLFIPIAPSIKIYESEKQMKYNLVDILPTDLKDYKSIYWQHLGVSLSSYSNRYKSVRINRPDILSVPSRGSGSISKIINAKKFNLLGKKIKLIVSVKADVKRNYGKGFLWVSVRRKNNERGFYYSMKDRPIIENEWKDFVIQGDVASDAKSVSIGGYLIGGGKFYLDNFRFIYKDDIHGWLPLNLKNMNFDNTIEGNKLTNWEIRGDNLYLINIKKENKKMGYVCVIQDKKKHNNLSSKLYDEDVKIGEVISKKLGSNLNCFVPISLYGNKKYTYPIADREKLSNLNKSLHKVIPEPKPLTNLHVRLGNIINFWNVFQHFYPYFDDIIIDWHTELNDALARSYNDKNETDHRKTLLRLLVALKDGHGLVRAFHDKIHAYPSFTLAYVENQIIVDNVMSGYEKVKLGDIILEVNGKKIKKIVEERLKYIPASTKNNAYYKLCYKLFYGPKGQEIRLLIQRGKQERKITISLDVNYKDYDKLTNGPLAQFKEFQKGLYYINLRRINTKQLNTKLELLKKAWGIIFDVRGTPCISPYFLNHLTKKKIDTTGWIKIMKTIYPDRRRPFFQNGITGVLQPKRPFLSARIFFLTNSDVISYGETFLSYVKDHRLGTIIGEHTGGTNGRMNIFCLPGNLYINFTGMKVTNHDGSQLFTFGIQPDIPLTRTIDGIRNGRDEFLEYTINYAKTQISHQTK